MADKEKLNTLWRNDPRTPEGKYLVKRRDGSIVEWPSFTLGARDPCAPAALRSYAHTMRALGMSSGMADDIMELAREFENYRMKHGDGDPDRGRHRTDDPAIIAEMKKGKSA